VSNLSGNFGHQSARIDEIVNEAQEIDIIMTKVHEANNSERSIKDNMSLNSPKLTSNSSNGKPKKSDAKNNDKSAKLFLSD
jgi:hypothetical protein